MKYVTLHKITVSAPGEAFEMSGHDAVGAPILRKRTITHLSASIVELTDAQAAELIAVGAVRKATSVELQAGRAASEVHNEH